MGHFNANYTVSKLTFVHVNGLYGVQQGTLVGHVLPIIKPDCQPTF